MSSQVINPAAAANKESSADAIARLFSAYQSFRSGQKEASQQDLIDQQAGAIQDAQQREQEGVLTPKEELGLATSGKFSFKAVPEDAASSPDFKPPEGAFGYRTTDNPDVQKFAIPRERDFKTPTAVQTDLFDPQTGQNYKAVFDPEQQKYLDNQGKVIENPISARQPKSSEELQAAADIKASQRTSEKKDRLFQTVQSQLEALRGNPAIQQSEKDLYAAGKAQSLVDRLGGGDPNNLTPQAATLLVGEIGKIAQGGSPTIHELDSLNPQTLNSKFAGIYQKITNEPTPANVGQFLQQYLDYADGLSEDARKTIQDRYGRIIESYKTKLTPDDLNTLKETYIGRFDADKQATDDRKAQQQKQQDEKRAAAVQELQRRGIKLGNQ